MSLVARDKGFSCRGDRHLEERQIVEIRKVYFERLWKNPLSFKKEILKHFGDAMSGEIKFGKVENLIVFPQNALVDQNRHLAFEDLLQNTSWLSLRMEKSGHQYVGVQDDPHLRP